MQKKVAIRFSKFKTLTIFFLILWLPLYAKKNNVMIVLFLIHSEEYVIPLLQIFLLIKDEDDLYPALTEGCIAGVMQMDD